MVHRFFDNNNFDKLILISGDGDFADLINRIKREGKEVEICYFEGCSSKSLLKKAGTLNIINKKVVNKFFLRENKINISQ
ncbi:MAG: NYN domain-containing protein [Nanoarchaeota archaeon]